MKKETVNGIELEYDVTGTGEPVLFISPVLADGFLPLIAQPSLAERYQLVRYHKRGWVSSTRTPGPVSVADHASDAAGLLDRLGIAPRTSSGTPAEPPSPLSSLSTHPNGSQRSPCSS